jgi:hypothetical protein
MMIDLPRIGQRAPTTDHRPPIADRQAPHFALAGGMMTASAA